MFSRKPLAPEADPTSLANVLIRLQWVTPAQVAEAISHKADQMLGEALMERGLISKEQLQHALDEQKMYRGEAPVKTIVKRTLDAQVALQDSLINGLKNIADLSVNAATGKFAPIKRST